MKEKDFFCKTVILSFLNIITLWMSQLLSRLLFEAKEISSLR